jgi:aminocarboxymuconate-semialdehyde decarboxylase
MQPLRPRPRAAATESLNRLVTADRAIPASKHPVWDVHTHTTLAPDAHAALARFAHYEDFVRVRAHATDACSAEIINSRGQVVRAIRHNAYDAEARRADCDRHGISMQVLSPTPMMIPDTVEHAADAAEICKILNDANAAIVAKFPQRFTALGALPMMFADLAIRELQRIRSLGMRGVEINSNVNGLDLDDPRFFPIFAAAAELDMAIFIHPWGGFMSPAEDRLKHRMHQERNWRPWLLGMGLETALAFDAMRCGGIHQRLPQLRVMYAHGGGAFPAMLGRLEHGSYCRPDLFRNASQVTPYETVQSAGVYVDALTHDPWVLNMLIEMLGTRRVAMGSDYPYPLGEMGTTPFDSADPLRNIYPGHMIHHLPETMEEMEAAWQHFHWLTRDTADGPRRLPLISSKQKLQLLSETAKEWLKWK